MNVGRYKKAIAALIAGVVGVFAVFGIDVSNHVEKASEIALIFVPVLVYFLKNE